MNKLFAGLSIVLAMSVFSQVDAASPLSKATWSSYTVIIDSIGHPADSYDVAIVAATENMNTAGVTALVNANTTNAFILLKDIMTGLNNGSYRFQVRAKVGNYTNAWSTPIDFTWSNLLPNLVSNVSINPL